MSRAPTRKLQVYIALAGVGAFTGLALGLVEVVALAAPFAAYVAVGLALSERPKLTIEPSLDRERVLEGETVVVNVELEARRPLELVELELRPPTGLVREGAKLRWSGSLRAGAREEATFDLRPRRWGGYALGTVRTRVRDRFGLIEYELAPVPVGSLRVFPAKETLRVLLAPLELQATTGSRTARERGEGIEFAENRPFLPGDRLRRINWRATARRGRPYVSERHPERNADVILFLDTFAEAGAGGDGTLALAVRAATSLAAAYLARKDRVGVVGFGGVLMGLRPRLGLAQLYRIIDALLGSEIVFSYAHKDVSFVPRRLLPPKALVIAITPLIDERYLGALLDLRARGFDLAVVEVSPESFAPPAETRAERIAHRLWLLQREALRTRLQELGAPVARWQDGEPVQVPLATAAELKRRQRRPLAA